MPPDRSVPRRKEHWARVEGAIIALEDDQKMRWALGSLPSISFYWIRSPRPHGCEFVRCAKNLMNFAQQGVWHKRLFQYACVFQSARIGIACDIQDLESWPLLSESH